MNFYKGQVNSYSGLKNSHNMENVLLQQRNYTDYVNQKENIVKDLNNLPNLKEKFSNLHARYKNSLEYPFNILLEYASSVYTVLELEEEISHHRKNIEEVYSIRK